MIKVNERKMLEMINAADLVGLKNYILSEMTISASSSGRKKDGLKAFYKLAEKKFTEGQNYSGAFGVESRTFVTNNHFVLVCNRSLEELAGIKVAEEDAPDFLKFVENYKVQAEPKNEVILDIPTLKKTLKTMKASKIPSEKRFVIAEDTEGKKQIASLDYLLMIDSVIDFKNGGKIYTGGGAMNMLYFRSGEESTLFEGVLLPYKVWKDTPEGKEIFGSWK